MTQQGAPLEFVFAGVATALTSPLWGMLYSAVAAWLAPALLHRELTQKERQISFRMFIVGVVVVGLVLVANGLVRLLS